MLKGNLQNMLVLLALSFLFFFLGNSVLSLTNPDEVFYAQTAKEMVEHKTWLVPYLFGQPQFEKPIFLYWLLRLSFIVFGITNFSARLPAALFAVIGALGVYLFGLLGFKNEKKAFLGSLIFMSSGLCIGMARTVFTDMVFSVLILCGLLAFYWGYCHKERKGWGLCLFFIFSALAVLAKGLLGFFIPFLAVLIFLAVKKELKFLFCNYSFWGVLIFMAIASPWYIFMIKAYGSSFIREFFYNGHLRRIFEAEHILNDTWYFYPFSMFGCMFPWTVYALAALFYLCRGIRKGLAPMHIFLLSWVAAVFLIFQPAHSKLVSYILPMFAALAMISADFIYKITLLEDKNRIFFIISLVMALIILVLPLGLLISLSIYPEYVPERLPVYIFSLILFCFSALFISFILRYKFFKSILCLSFLLPLPLFFALFMHQNIEPYVSSQASCEYLLKNYNVGGIILCAKPFARGVRFYTDKEIAVADMGKNYFSPHPITFLNSGAAVNDFIIQRPGVYCIFNRATVEDIEEVLVKSFRLNILKIIGNVYIARIESRE